MYNNIICKGLKVIQDGIDLHYITKPVDSEDQATSLEEYLKRHGQDAYKNGADEVIIPMEYPDEEVGPASAKVHMLISCWKMFWEHSDKGVFELPVYVKD